MLPVKNICDIQLVANERKALEKSEYLSREESGGVERFHKSLFCYEATPLVELSALAKKLGVKSICVKDESKRFGLKAFKGLGGSYVVFRVVCEKLGLDPEATTLEDLKSEKYREFSSTCYI